MTRREVRLPPLSQRLVLIAAAMAAMGIVLLAIERASVRRGMPAAAGAVEDATAHSRAIPDAEVFRTTPGMLAAGWDARRRPDAHPRTLATYRLLRSYPGAPPRIPHGLTATEFRTNRCNTCHERGGYSQRFGAYAPVNPHPEWTACLQCHAANDLLVGLPFPQTSSDDTCRQCHSGGPERFRETGLDWRTASWPPVSARPVTGVPEVPHELATRGNCLACHAGPGAIAEIRTTHPERLNCLQCHVVPGVSGEFVRAASGAGR